MDHLTSAAPPLNGDLAKEEATRIPIPSADDLGSSPTQASAPMAAGSLASVVVAVDGSEESMNALRWAIDNLRIRPDGALVALHVQPPPNIAAGLNPGPIPFGGPHEVEVPAFTQAIEAHQRRITQAILDHALKICKEKNVEVETEVVVGDPKEKICEVTANLKADLLVMGCRAFGPLKRMFLGSVSNYCINHVGSPVVVIKGT